MVVLYFLFTTPAVQTWICRKLTDNLAAQLKTKVEIKGVEIKFFTQVVIDGIYVEDFHKDTVFYARKLQVDIGIWSYKEQYIELPDITMQDAHINVVYYKNDTDLNIRYLAAMLEDNDTTPSTDSTKWSIIFGDINLVNVEVIYCDKRDSAQSKVMDFEDLHITKIFGKFSNMTILDDTIYVDITDLAARERSGFRLSKLTAKATFCPVFTKLDNLHILTNESDIRTNLRFDYTEYNDYNRFVRKVKMHAEFDSSLVQLGDIGYFASELFGMRRTIMLSGDINGKVTNLKGQNMDIVLAENTRFKGHFSFTGLPDIDETYMHFDIKELTTTKKDVEAFPLPPFDSLHYVKLSDNMDLLGKIKYKGKLNGYYYDLVSDGQITTALGKIVTNVNLKKNPETGLVSYIGNVKSYNFDVGKLIAVPELGEVTLNADVDGSGLKLSTLRANLSNCNIQSMWFNGYNYTNVVANGLLAKKIFNGNIKVKDDNVDLSFFGDVNLGESPVKIDFMTYINRADLAALNFVKSNEHISVATTAEVHIQGDNLDNIIGRIILKNTDYIQGKKFYEVKNIDLSANTINGKRIIKLQSDLADGAIEGRFKINDVYLAFKKTMEFYLPATTPQDRKSKRKLDAQDIYFEFEFKDTDPLTNLLAPEINISKGSKVNGKFDSEKSDLVIKASFPFLKLSGTEMKKLYVDAASQNGKYKFKSGCDRYVISDTIWADSLALVTSTATDSINFKINWNNKGKVQNMGDLKGFFDFNAYPQVYLKFTKANMLLNDSVWAMSNINEVMFDTNSILIRDLAFTNKIQQIKFDGVISNKKSDQLYVLLNNFNVANLNYFTAPDNLAFKGTVSGSGTLSNVYKMEDIIFSSSFDFKNLWVNKEEVGSGGVVSIFDKKKNAIKLNGSFSKGGSIPNFEFAGEYFPGKEKENINMDVSVQNFGLKFFEPYIKDVCDLFRGFVSVNVKITGEVKKPILTGEANLQAQNIHLNYLNTNYSVTNGIIKIEENSFAVDGLVLNDMNGKAATLTGHVYHNNFKNTQLDLDIKTEKFMVLNTNQADNNLYYGKAYVTGIANMFGYLDNIQIDAAVKTDKVKTANGMEYTKFNVPLSGPVEASNSDFITFLKKDTIKKQDDYKVDLNGLTLNLQLEATPDAEVKLIFDEKVGDEIKARGSGNIVMNINTNGAFSMFGDFEVEEGDYLFTLQNLINKKFKIDKGGTIKWSGDPYNAEINMSATYQVRTNLAPFFPDDSSGLYKKRVPTDCVLLLTGALMSPDIGFDFNLPTVDANTLQTVKSYVSTQQEMNQQIFTLLVLNSFTTPDALKSQGFQDQNTNGTGTALGATGSELLSNQLSNWLSQISNDFDLGVRYRPGDFISKDEVEVALSTQLFNDKLSIDGSVSNNTNTTNTQNTSTIVGDVNIEYKITDDGKVRVKAYNKTNDNIILNPNATYTQGVGVFYREEFDSLAELYRKYQEKTKNKKKK
jgi:hypothetical protein